MMWGSLVTFFLLFGTNSLGKNIYISLINQGIQNVGLIPAIAVYMLMLIIFYFIGRDILEDKKASKNNGK